jgi:hypothetical protein
MPEGQVMHVDAQDRMGAEETKYQQGKTASNTRAFHGRAGNLSSRPQGMNANTAALASHSGVQKSRKKYK